MKFFLENLADVPISFLAFRARVQWVTKMPPCPPAMPLRIDIGGQRVLLSPGTGLFDLEGPSSACLTVPSFSPVMQ